MYEMYIDSVVFIPLQKKIDNNLNNSLAILISTNSKDKYFIIYINSFKEYSLMTNEDISNELWEFKATAETLVVGSIDSGLGVTVIGSQFEMYQLNYTPTNPYQALIDLGLIKTSNTLRSGIS